MPTINPDLGNVPAEEDWSGLSDIVEINKFDPNWNQEVQSSRKEEQTGESTNVKPKAKKYVYSRDKGKQREYRERFIAKVKSDPIKKEWYRERKKQWNAKWEAKATSKLTTQEKVAYELEKRKRSRQSNLRGRINFGGFSCGKMQRLNQIRILKAKGTATEEDLKFLHDYQASERARKKKGKREETRFGEN